ncbi:glutamate-rich protein 1 isoform X2 [Lonchura striata]|uniref:glutamate-rich protein 1 n=1 Tax=Lonchura striata TaxID=40157 RepID=UPI000B4C52C7|nr:glutamate-rich protein 1 [Lonchura striata domestica]
MAAPAPGPTGAAANGEESGRGAVPVSPGGRGAMAASRRDVFLAKLLKRLYGETSSSSLVQTSSREEEVVLENLGSKSQEKNLDNIQISSADASTSTTTPCESFQDNDDTVTSPRRVYTVDLPPEGYVAVTPDALSKAVSEASGSSADSTEEEYQGQTKRKRIRRKKQKSSSQISSNFHGEQTDLGIQETVQDNLQLQQTNGPKISKNKKRKMKKKRQKEKKRAAGLVTTTTSVDFTYQPDKNSKEEAAGLKDIDEKTDSILDFLQATQQIYFTDKKSECRDAAVNSATTQELLKHLEFRTISSSDVTHLHRLKSLVLLQDIERLKDALKQFQEQSMMSPDHAKVATSLFHYWITDILPVKNRK